MAELKNARHEQFAKMVALGMDAYQAHGKAGFRADRSNSSKLAREPDIAARIAELRAERAERDQMARGEVDANSGAAELRRALLGAVTAGQWGAAVSAARHLADLDGSGEALAPAEADGPEERKRILRELFELFPESAHPSLEAYLAQPAARPSAVPS
jgi:hypothetical protein